MELAEATFHTIVGVEMRKLRALIKYFRLFKNWPYAALSRYLKVTGRPRVCLELRNGHRLWFRPASDYVAVGEVFVAETYRDCLRVIDPKLVWDIGGNIGCFPIWAAPHFGQARFISFEPCHETYALLNVNRDANSSIRWTTLPFGLAASEKTVTAFIPHGMYAETSVYADEGTACELPLQSVTEVWKEHGRPFIDLMKIDCEGGEYEIFDAISGEMLSQIGSIVLEYHAVAGKSIDAIATKLVANGFRFDMPRARQGVIWISRA